MNHKRRGVRCRWRELLDKTVGMTPGNGEKEGRGLGGKSCRFQCSAETSAQPLGHPGVRMPVRRVLSGAGALGLWLGELGGGLALALEQRA